MKETSNKHQREYRINPNVGCEDCDRETCPYIYCQHMECMTCESRAMCPMCDGDCEKCQKYTYCIVFAES